jgi:NAD(P)-dependent dehydrogenase (short-subunit alcohol dehydrogenase family)
MGARILVLGGGSDIARAAVVALSRDRPLDVVVVAARSPSDAEADMGRALDATSAGTVVTGESWDATVVGGHGDCAARWTTDHGPFDVVICAVGVLGHHAGSSMAPVDVEAMFATNSAGPASMLAALAPHLISRGRGVVVVLSSVAAARPRRSNFVYGASKAALDAYAQGLGDAVAPHGVRVVVVRPGFVRSTMTEGLDPAPFSTTPDVVGAAIARAVGDEGVHTVWVPTVLGPLMAVMRVMPRSLWRRIAGDR